MIKAVCGCIGVACFTP
ncbi:hypothetical protein LAZ44_29320 [Vibrio alginolyticus]|nr:hypothetical protein [Vibrio alginolyticus]MDF4941874.1 hypothetical protein [Vibrio parahaemolyticus]